MLAHYLHTLHVLECIKCIDCVKITEVCLSNMADIQSNLVKTLSKVIDSTKPGYAPTGLGAQVSAARNENTLTLTVVAVRNNAITVQATGNTERFSLEKSQLQGLGSRTLSPGDKLVLLNNTPSQTVSFNVRSEQNNAAINIPANAIQTLKQQWPDITTTALKQAQANVLTVQQYPSYTQNAKNIVSSVINIALQKQIPQGIPIQATTIGKIIQISPLAISIKLNSTNTNKNDFIIQVPVPKELSQVLKQGQNIQLSINTQGSSTQTSTINNKGPIESLSIVKVGVNVGKESSLPASKLDAITNAQLASINSNLRSRANQIEQLISPVLLSQSDKSVSNIGGVNNTSQNLANGIVLSAKASLLNALPAPLKQNLLQAASSEQIRGAQVQILQTTQNQLIVRLLEKPVIISVDKNAVATINELMTKQTSLAGKANIESLTSKTQIDNTALGKTSGGNTSSRSIGNENFNENANKDARLIEDSLKTKLTQKIQQSIDASNMTSSLSKIDRLNASALPPTEKQMAIVNAKLDDIKTLIKEQQNVALAKGEPYKVLAENVINKLNIMADNAGPDLKILLRQVIANMTASKSTDIQDVFKQALITVSSESEASQNAQALNQVSQSSTSVNSSLANTPLLNAPVLNSALFSAGGSGLVSGLVTMFQASLQAKLISQQPQLLAQLTQFIPALQAKKPSYNKSANIKAVQDLQRLDPKHSLIDDLSKLLNQHNLLKLSSFEASLQGQDSFYYTLPNLFSSAHQDFEILIKKKQHEESKEQEKQIQQHWQLSMKLDIGKLGKVLAKINLVQENLDLHMYASSPALKDKIEALLPLLNERLESLGLNVKQKCYLGKIPDKLYKTEYQVVHAYV